MSDSDEKYALPDEAMIDRLRLLSNEEVMTIGRRLSVGASTATKDDVKRLTVDNLALRKHLVRFQAMMTDANKRPINISVPKISIPPAQVTVQAAPPRKRTLTFDKDGNPTGFVEADA